MHNILVRKATFFFGLDDLLVSSAETCSMVRSTVGQIRERGHSVAIVSSNSLDWIHARLEESQLTEFVNSELVFSARSSDVPLKPDPAIYKIALARVRTNGPIIAVEPSTSGVKSALTAGVPTVIGCVAFSLADMRKEQAALMHHLGAHCVLHDWSGFIPTVKAAIDATENKHRAALHAGQRAVTLPDRS